MLIDVDALYFPNKKKTDCKTVEIQKIIYC